MSDHPRNEYDLIPNPDAEQAFLDALDRGRLHHAWLVAGVEGLGKATFAYRAARRLLGARPSPAHGPLGASPSDPVSQLVAAQSHPDLLVMERLVEGGKTKKAISVDQARELPEFFAKSPSRAEWRVAIIDAADDLNMNAANALLKALEEPPERGVLFLITHAPGRLLPTIRSRCRRLRFAPWSRHALADLLQDRTTLGPGAAETVAGMAGGSPGAALSLASGPMLEMDALARDWVDGGSVDRARALKTADGFRGGEGPAKFDMLIDRLAAVCRDQALALSAQGKATANGAAWSDLWRRLIELPERATALNLDRAELLAGAVADLERVKAGR